MALFRNKFRVESSRWKWQDYSSSGNYFVTICTKSRCHFFGRITNRMMVLSKQGIIVEKCWRLIPAHYPNLKLGVYAIMPDHFHGIVTIVDTGRDVGTGRDVETGHAPSLPLGNIIGSFKSAVTREINQTGFRGFGWQERYHDRVIRNEQEFRRIEKYIRDNPKNWK